MVSKSSLTWWCQCLRLFLRRNNLKSPLFISEWRLQLLVFTLGLSSNFATGLMIINFFLFFFISSLLFIQRSRLRKLHSLNDTKIIHMKWVKAVQLEKKKRVDGNAIRAPLATLPPSRPFHLNVFLDREDALQSSVSVLMTDATMAYACCSFREFLKRDPCKR